MSVMIFTSSLLPDITSLKSLASFEALPGLQTKMSCTMIITEGFNGEGNGYLNLARFYKISWVAGLVLWMKATDTGEMVILVFCGPEPQTQACLLIMAEKTTDSPGVSVPLTPYNIPIRSL